MEPNRVQYYDDRLHHALPQLFMPSLLSLLLMRISVIGVTADRGDSATPHIV
jgi:hypothetical protein